MEQYTKPCPSCGAEQMLSFYRVSPVPIHSVLLHTTREEAIQLPSGEIDLGYCEACGFISNMAFEPEVMRYSGRYESTQAYSPTFNRFQKQLGESLIERYNLRHKRLLEIGCGQGEFLTFLCQQGPNTGIGFDPAYDAERAGQPQTEGLTFIADYYSEKYADLESDFLFCKMTLEHIPNVAEFVGMVRRAIQNRPETVVFFQVPNAVYVFEDIAFWDIYYEHCSYFSPQSLASLFQAQGFQVLNLWTDYDDQYLMIEARPGKEGEAILPLMGNLVSLPEADVTWFSTEATNRQTKWHRKFTERKEAGLSTVLWGGGSKAVSFLTTLGLSEEDIACAVDINPHKAGTYLAGTGHPVVQPATLVAHRPDVVIIMNPIYRNEIQAEITRMGLTPLILTV